MLVHEDYLRRNLKFLMNRNHLTQNDLAKGSGVTQQTISNVLKSGRIRIDKLEPLAEYFKIPADKFYSSDISELINLGSDSENVIQQEIHEKQTLEFILPTTSDAIQLKIERMIDGKLKVSITAS